MSVKRVYDYQPYQTSPAPGNGTKDHYTVSSNVFPDFSMSTNVTYKMVTEYSAAFGGTKSGKTVYHYDVEDDDMYFQFQVIPGTFSKVAKKTFKDWGKNQLVKKELYKKENNSYSLIEQENYDYQVFEMEEIEGLKAYYRIGLSENGSSVPENMIPDLFYDPVEPNGLDHLKDIFQLSLPYAYYSYTIKCGATKIKKKETIKFDNSNVINEVVEYIYEGDDHIMPTKVITQTSKGVQSQREITYPQDVVNPTNAITELVNRNMVNTPLEEVLFMNGQQIEKIIYKYAVYSTGNVAISEILKAFGNSSPVVMVSYSDYDQYGNPLQSISQKKIPISYLYENHGQDLVCVAENALFNDIAYTSFESETHGGWGGIQNENCMGNIYCVTGKKLYSSSQIHFTKNFLNPLKKYQISYWCKGDGLSVVGDLGMKKVVKLLNINGATWKKNIHEITGVNEITLTGSGEVDELTIQPVSAIMKTANYDPLIGLLSKTDENGLTQNYEYDGFGRLVFIKNINKEILNQFKYNLSALYEPARFYNDEISSVFQMQNCHSGSIGQSLMYTVAAETFYSYVSKFDANQRALAELNSSGQINANKYGECIPNILPLVAENTTSDNISILVINSLNGNMYNYNIPANSTVTLNSNLPPAIYNVAFVSGATSPRTFRVFNRIEYNQTNFTFYNISLDCVTCNQFGIY